jgi:hypothetical protein
MSSDPSETTTLLPSSSSSNPDDDTKASDGNHDIEGTSSSHGGGCSSVTKLFLGLQTLLIILFITGTQYSEENYKVKEYIAFRDIMAMLLLGFGYLMTFLKHYGLGAVGFTMMLSIVAMELNMFVELFVRFLYHGREEEEEDTSWPMSVSMATLIDAEFAAATLMITFGALIGRTTPLQMLLVAMSQSFFYAFNKVVLVLGALQAEDVGGSMTIHMFVSHKRKRESKMYYGFFVILWLFVSTISSLLGRLLWFGRKLCARSCQGCCTSRRIESPR